jgi:hypothetical protein
LARSQPCCEPCPDRCGADCAGNAPGPCRRTSRPDGLIAARALSAPTAAAARHSRFMFAR